MENKQVFHSISQEEFKGYDKMIIDFFGLVGFWNRKKRMLMIELLEQKLPKNYFIEEIGWFTAREIEKGVYEVYTKIAHLDRAKRVRGDYWDYRTNGNTIFDLETNKVYPNWVKLILIDPKVGLK